MEKKQWGGYVDILGTLQAKRYFGPEDIQEAHESPFCKQVVGPFEAENREKALEILEHQLRQTELEVKILQLLSAQLISSSEFRSLTKMCNSVDAENLTVAEETVNNLMKNL